MSHELFYMLYYTITKLKTRKFKPGFALTDSAARHIPHCGWERIIFAQATVCKTAQCPPIGKMSKRRKQ